MDARQIIQIAGCGVTVVLGLMLALVLDAGPEMATMGWIFAAAGALGLVLTLAVSNQHRRR